jgi:hypothetical protein
MADDHPRTGAGASAETYLGGEGAASHDILVLSEVPAIPERLRYGPGVRARGAR